MREDKYRKIPKISPGAYIRPFLRGLSTEGNSRFTIDWASLIVGSKFTVFALFYFVFEGNFPSTSPRGAYIWRGNLTEGFLRYRFGGAIFEGAYFRNFTIYKKALPRTRENHVCAILHMRDIRKNVLPKFIIRFCMETLCLCPFEGHKYGRRMTNRNICF